MVGDFGDTDDDGTDDDGTDDGGTDDCDGGVDSVDNGGGTDDCDEGGDDGNVLIFGFGVLTIDVWYSGLYGINRGGCE